MPHRLQRGSQGRRRRRRGQGPARPARRLRTIRRRRRRRIRSRQGRRIRSRQGRRIRQGRSRQSRGGGYDGGGRPPPPGDQPAPPAPARLVRVRLRRSRRRGWRGRPRRVQRFPSGRVQVGRSVPLLARRRGAAAPPPSDRRDDGPKVELGGDWNCDGCGNSNFSWRKTCKKCNAPKSQALKDAEKAATGVGSPLVSRTPATGSSSRGSTRRR